MQTGNNLCITVLSCVCVQVSVVGVGVFKLLPGEEDLSVCDNLPP